MSSIFTLIAVSNALSQIVDGYSKLHAPGGRGGLPIGLQKGDGPLGTQLRPNESPAAAKDAYRAPGSCDTYEPGRVTCGGGGATQYAFAFNAQQVPSVGRMSQFTHQASTEPGITPAVWPYANPLAAALPDQPYEPNRIPQTTVKNLYNFNNPYPFAADMNGRMLDVFA